MKIPPPTVFVIFGMPGAGKETLQKLMTAHIQIVLKKEVFQSDTGNLFRNSFAANNDALLVINDYNRQISQEIQDSGRLQPSAPAVALWTAHFWKHYVGQPYIIIDGSPRRPEEALILIQFLNEQYQAKIFYLYVIVPKEVALARMAERHTKHPRKETATHDSRCKRIDEFFTLNYPVISEIAKKEMVYEMHNEGTIEDLEISVRNYFHEHVL